MKKTSLLVGAVALALNVSAQSAMEKSPVFGGNTSSRELPARYHNIIDNNTVSPNKAARMNGAKNKTTSATERWYSFYDEVANAEGVTLNDATHSKVFPIWFDSTIVQHYAGNVSAPINYSSVYQYIDPINPYGFFNDPNYYLGEMRVGSTNTYTVDSIYLRGSYIAALNRPGGIVDTLIVSVAPASPGTYSYYKTQYHFAQYLPAGVDTFKAFTQYNVDSVGRGLFSDVTGGNRLYWKIPLTVADRDTESSTGFPTKYFVYAIPNNGIQMSAGRGFGFSFTFKSGDTWTANVDTVGSRHYFMPIASEAADGAAMPYYYYKNLPSTKMGERSMASMMFSTDPSSYIPTYMIESWNSNDFSSEFFDMGAHVTCTTCPTVTGVKEVSSIQNVGTVYPNPATENVTVPFTMKDAATVNVTISNMLGQVIKTQNLGQFNANQAGKATFSTSDLTNGMYLISVEANGQRVTKRFAVTH